MDATLHTCGMKFNFRARESMFVHCISFCLDPKWDRKRDPNLHSIVPIVFTSIVSITNVHFDPNFDPNFDKPLCFSFLI